MCVLLCFPISLHASESGCVNWSVIDTEDSRAPVFFPYLGDGNRYPFPWANPIMGLEFLATIVAARTVF